VIPLTETPSGLLFTKSLNSCGPIEHLRNQNCFLIFSLCLLVSLGTPRIALADELTNTRATLQGVWGKIETLKQNISQTELKRKKNLEDLRKTEQAISKVHLEIQTTEKAVAAHEQQLRPLLAQEQALSASLKLDQKALADQLRLAHRMGEQPALKLLLNQENPAKLAREVAYYDYFNRARIARIYELETKLDELSRIRAEARAQDEVLTVLRDKQATLFAQLSKANTQRNRALNQLDKQLQDQTQEVNELEAQAAQLTKLMATLSRPKPSPVNRSDPQDDDDNDASSSADAKLPQSTKDWPVKGPILANYGSPRQKGKLRWQGMMIGATEGADIRAPKAGVVIFADQIAGYGLTLILQHKDDHLTLYGHNQVLFRGVGDRVKGGELIGRVGTSGGLRRPALYFEVRDGVEPVDPIKWLSGR